MAYFGHDESAAEHALSAASGLQRFRLGMRAYYYSFAHPFPTTAR